MSQHHRRIGWNGNTSRQERARLLPLLPLPCGRCGRPVLASEPWVVGHVDDLAVHGRDTGARQPEHARCSAVSGGRLSQRLAGRPHAVKDIREW